MTGGVVASLLNPRLIAFTSPGYVEDWLRAGEWGLTATRFTQTSYCRGLSDAPGAILDGCDTPPLARFHRLREGEQIEKQRKLPGFSSVGVCRTR